MKLEMEPERIVAIGDEALAVIQIKVQVKRGEPVLLNVITHFYFNGDGLVQAQRIFFDEFCLASLPGERENLDPGVH